MGNGRENMLYIQNREYLLALPFSPEFIIPSSIEEDKIKIRVYQLSLILPVLCVYVKFLLSLYDKKACPTIDRILDQGVEDNVWI
jgi:hypothetical protein